MAKKCPHDSCIKSTIKGFAHGITYGTKVRFTHSLVMALLFSNDSLPEKLRKILKNTQEHSLKLASFVAVFKSLVCLLTTLTHRRSSSNHALSGLFSSFIWSKDTPVNTQITFYLFSRNLVGQIKLFHKNKLIQFPEWLVKHSFCILTVACWGIVMYLFETHPKALQSSLTSSMNLLYKDSDRWQGWGHCIPYYESLRKLIPIS